MITIIIIKKKNGKETRNLVFKLVTDKKFST